MYQKKFFGNNISMIFKICRMLMSKKLFPPPPPNAHNSFWKPFLTLLFHSCHIYFVIFHEKPSAILDVLTMCIFITFENAVSLLQTYWYSGNEWFSLGLNFGHYVISKSVFLTKLTPKRFRLLPPLQI